MSAGEQLVDTRDAQFQRLGDLRPFCAHIKVPLALEVAIPFEAIALFHNRPFLGAQVLPKLVGRPNVELAFLAF